MTINALVVGIYRQRNEPYLSELLEGGGEGFRTALWAFDSVTKAFSGFTVGEGPAPKFELINQILERQPPGPDEHVVVVDDDVTFVHGRLRAFVSLAAAAGFDLAQPAHAWRSHRSHDITRRRAASVARRTTFVEIGPVFLVAPTRRDELVPFPENAGMGWGLELDWYDLHTRGGLLGIVDHVSMRHHVPPGVGYDIEGERAANSVRLRARGVERMADLQHTLETWRPWRRAPPWVR